MQLPPLNGHSVSKISDTSVSALVSPSVSELSRLQEVVQLLFPSTVHIQNVDTLEGHVHHLRLLKLSNGLQLVLKSSPSSATPLLRRERLSLETEARALALLGQCANPCIPQLFHYHPHGAPLGTAFLLRQYVKGSTLLETEPLLTHEDRKDIHRHLGFLVNVIGQQVSTSFGPLDKVASGAGSRSWRRAFISLFEEVLRDAEDMFIHLPYGEIREQVLRLAPSLEEVALPRLVIASLGRPSQVLLDPELKQLTGIIDLGSALWGDVLMAEVFEDPSDALFDGFGSDLPPDGAQHIRLLLYVILLIRL
jgi:hypothetical protein